MKPAAIVGWSGYGDFADLLGSAASKLSGMDAKVRAGPSSLLIECRDPVAVSRRLAHLPGVAWVAVGFRFEGEEGFLAKLRGLAGRYLRSGSSFSLKVTASESRREEGDLLLEGVGAILKAVKGTRVDDRTPEAVFRAVMVGERGAVGKELKTGPGGVPTSARATVSCLVSGGYHSAVAGWMAALSGYSLTLVHSRADDESLRQVARLYSELSHRVDPSGLELLVIGGGGPAWTRLAAWLEHATGDVIAGVHPECRGPRARTKFRGYPIVQSPLLLLSEEEVLSKLDALGLKRKPEDDVPSLKAGRGRGKSTYRIARIGGLERDVSGVLDSLDV